MKMRVLLAVLAVAALPGLAHADGDAAKGEKVFRKCKACHVADAQKNRVGPYLLGVVGRKAASVEGYHYSPAMTAEGAKGVVWDKRRSIPTSTIPRRWCPAPR